MKIGISTITDIAKSGTWQVIKNLIRNLKEIDRNNDYLIFVGNDYANDFGDSSSKFVIYRTNFTAENPIKNIFWHSFILPFILREHKVDILHLPWQSSSLLIKTMPVILTIHDLTEYRLKGHYSFLRTIYRKTMLPISSRLSNRIISVSKYTCNEIINILGICEEKIRVIYNGVNELYQPIDKKTFSEIKTPFILYVGQIHHPNKNLLRLIEAFKKLKEEGMQEKLFLVGKKGKDAKIIEEKVKKLNLIKDVIFLGYLPEEDLPYLYNFAEVFVYPSLYEGFGLPVVEAMACGCPVVTSNISALPEVTGGAAILVDPQDVDAIAKGILDVITNPELKKRLRERSLAQAKKFTWASSAEKTLQVYEEVLKSKV